MSKIPKMFKVSSESLSRHSRRVHWVKLGLFSSPILGAYFYSYTGYNSPFFCPFRALTGIPCPSCGMTRSLIALANGNLAQSLHYHFFGIFVFIGFIIAVVHLSIELKINRKMTAFYTQLCLNRRIQISALVLFLLYYIYRLYNWEKAGNYPYYFMNLLGKN